MIAVLSGWVRTLAFGALFTAMVLALVPEGNEKRAVKLVCGAALTLLLLRLPAGGNALRMGEVLAEQRSKAAGMAAEAGMLSQETLRSLIREETEEYIWDAARRLGIERLGVRLELKDGAEIPYPWSVSLRGLWTEEQRSQLSWLLEGDLDIPPERQFWSTEDAD